MKKSFITSGHDCLFGVIMERKPILSLYAVQYRSHRGSYTSVKETNPGSLCHRETLTVSDGWRHLAGVCRRCALNQSVVFVINPCLGLKMNATCMISNYLFDKLTLR